MKLNLLPRLRRALFPESRLYLSSYEAARAACGDGYEATDLTAVVAAKTVRYSAGLEGDSPLITDLGSLRVCYALAGLGRNLNVMDFGGACGAHYMTAEKLMGAGSIRRWAVVETPAMTAAGAFFASDFLRFFQSISEASCWLGSVDAVFVSGSIQFPEKPRRALDSLLNIPAKRLVFTRTPMDDFGVDRVYIQKSRLQDNGIGLLPDGFIDREIRYPSWVFDRASFVRAIAKTRRIVAEINEGDSHFGFVADQRPVGPIK